MQHTEKNDFRFVFVLSLLFIVLYGSGFVGPKLGFPYAKPMIFLGVRFAIAAGLLTLFAFIFRASWPKSWRQVGHISVSGFLLVALFAGGTWTAVDMGLQPAAAALISALQPLAVAIASY